jgi:hypothetical protein
MALKTFLSIAVKLFIVAFILSTSLAYAAPTPKATSLAWDQPDLTDVSGWRLYYLRESVTPPRDYAVAPSVDVGMLSSIPTIQCPDVNGQPASDVCYKAMFIDLNVSGQGRWCFVATAYNSAQEESDFSNEICAFFGLPKPENLRGE